MKLLCLACPHGDENFLKTPLEGINAENISGKIAKIGNVKIAGLEYFCELEWVKTFIGKGSHRADLEKFEENQAKAFLSKLEKVDIFLTHNPPYECLDLVDNPVVPESWNGKHVRSKLVLEYIQKKMPKYVVCGHIHEDQGVDYIGEETKIINISQSWFILDI